MGFDFMAQNQRMGMVDLAVQGAGNWFLTGKATESADLRWTMAKEGEPSKFYQDYRFIAGAAGVAMMEFGKGQMARAGMDIAGASLGSFVATERVRQAAIQRVNPQGPARPQAGPPPQLAPPTPAGSAFANFARSVLPGSYA